MPSPLQSADHSTMLDSFGVLSVSCHLPPKLGCRFAYRSHVLVPSPECQFTNVTGSPVIQATVLVPSILRRPISAVALAVFTE